MSKIAAGVCLRMGKLALVALAMNPAYHKDFLSAVKSWPRSIYSVPTVLSEIEPQLRASLMTDDLKEMFLTSLRGIICMPLFVKRLFH